VGDVKDFFQNGPELMAAMELLRQYESTEHKYVLNEVRWKQVRKAFNSICEFFRESDSDARIEFKIESIGTVASVWIKTDSISIMDIPAFIEVIKVANNLSIDPLLNGKIKIAMTFADIAYEIVPKKPKKK